MSILDLIYPKNCLDCKKPGKYICKNCLKKVPKLGWTNNEIYSIWKYEGIIRLAILALKYRFAYQIADELADLCVKELKTSSYFLVPNAYLIPVPLHKLRQNWRGFNQAEKIGEKIAKEMNWKFNPKLIVKTEASQPQAELTRGERLRNLRGKFAVNKRSAILSEVEEYDSTYIIFDDVATTGSTIKEITKVLKEKGAKKVVGLTIAS